MLQRVQGSLHAQIRAAVGESVSIRTQRGSLLDGEVIGFDQDIAQIMAFSTNANFQVNDLVIASGKCATVPTGGVLLGRVLNSKAHPIDGLGPINATEHRDVIYRPVRSTERTLVNEVIPTGIRAIDGLLTIGRGQRVGIFAGSGVGKSTLLSELVKNSSADVNVVALVGERGREVRPFIEHALGEAGMRKSVLVVSTSDESPLSRIRAADSAVAIADSFREKGSNVLLLLDSLTRYATAQKELSLMLGEPPASRGFPASVFQRIAILLEQLGNSGQGSITGIVTVLVDGDDMNEPVSDSAHSILDGHIVLKRELAEQNHYPAIDIPGSVSRLFREICSEEHVKNAAVIRKTISLYREVEDLIRIGAYKTGNVPATDRAIESMTLINDFLRQQGAGSDFKSTLLELNRLAEFCEGVRSG